MERSEELFSMSLEKYAMRYPYGCRGFGSSIFADLVRKGDENMLKNLLKRKLDAEFMLEQEFTEEIEITPFGLAISRDLENATNLVEVFLQHGCKPESVVSRPVDKTSGITAILAAVGTGKLSMVEIMIQYGADINFANSGLIKRTPLQRAAEIGNKEIVELLYNHGADVNALAAVRSGGTALQLAAIGGYIPLVCNLISWKADVNAPASRVNGRTALEGAAEHGRLDMVQLLIDSGADPVVKEK